MTLAAKLLSAVDDIISQQQLMKVGAFAPHVQISIKRDGIAGVAGRVAPEPKVNHFWIDALFAQYKRVVCFSIVGGKTPTCDGIEMVKLRRYIEVLKKALNTEAEPCLICVHMPNDRDIAGPYMAECGLRDDVMEICDPSGAFSLELGIAFNGFTAGLDKNRHLPLVVPHRTWTYWETEEVGEGSAKVRRSVLKYLEQEEKAKEKGDKVCEKNDPANVLKTIQSLSVESVTSGVAGVSVYDEKKKA